MLRRTRKKKKEYEDAMKVSHAKCTVCGHEFMTGSGKILIKCPLCKRPAKRIIQESLK